MDRATRSKIEEWESRPVSGGYAGLSDLASAEFTGVVTADGAHLFMLNGKVVGVVDGTISAFESGESTAYKAPDPALPLLFAMRERSGEVQGQYYTDDTPIQEVDQTLSEGGFTGYLELSENVLSGDYYVVYYGGRSLSAAFVGNEERVVTGSEAFDLAADEVGIYEVQSVDLEVIDVPEPPEGATAAAGVAESDEADDHAAGEPEAVDAEPVDEDETASEPAAADAAVSDTEPTADDSPAEPPTADEEASGADDVAETANDETSTETAGSEGTAGEPADDDAPIAEAEADAGSGTVDEAEESPGSAETAETGSADTTSTASRAPPSKGTEGARSPRGEPGGEEHDERFKEEERWRESRTVPALDPEESELRSRVEQASEPEPEPSPAQQTQPTSEPATDPDELQALRERVDELEAALESTENERRRQTERVEELVEERDDLRSERDALADRIEELEARIEEQEAAAETPSTEPAPSSGAEAGRSVDPATALDQTDLFVRYDSKGQATLQSAHDGRADRDAVEENLRIEMHSRFDADDTTVDGRPFQDYLEDTIEYRFVAWLIEDLLYEIQDTGSERALRLLFDALPEVDRAEFAGTITADDEGEEREITFDVVCRDRMGKPLIVANINDSLDPATGDMMAGLIEDATAAGEGHESIGSAFLVTASFFQPDALETASGATGGGFLSRDSKKSFVKLARKGGYHLCLAEARGGDFHIAVPDV